LASIYYIYCMQVLEKGQYSGEVTGTLGSVGLLASVTSYNGGNFNNALHYHDNAHFSFALQGGCVEKKKDSYEITPGHITYYSAGEQHQVLKVPKPTRRVNLEIENGFFEQFGISDHAARFAVTRNPDAKFLMVKIYHELITNDCLSEMSIQMLLLQLISDTKKQRNSFNIPQWVNIIGDFLRSHTDDTITLEALSQAANLHPVTISKQFPKYFSCTVGEYKRKLKIEKSLCLLKSNPASLTDVAYECGFFDQSHFIRTFKALTGILPRNYQKF